MKKQKSSIFKQILTPMLLLVCVLVVAILAMVWVFTASSFKKQISSDNAEAARLMANDISGFLSEAYAVSEELAVNPSILTMDTEVQTPILENCVKRNPYFELLYIQGADGMQTGRSSGKLADRGNRWWFIQTMEEKQPFVSKSYYSVNTNMPCTSVFVPMVRDGEIIGIMASDIKLDSLVELVNEMSEDGKTAFIIDGEGTVVAHPEHHFVEELYNYKTLTRTVSQKNADGSVKTAEDGSILTQEEGFEISADFAAAISAVMGGQADSRLITEGGKKYFLSCSPVTLDGNSDSWSVLLMQSYSTAMSPTVKLLAALVGISILVLVVIIFIMALIIKRISQPIVDLSGLVSEAADGNFLLNTAEYSSRELNLLSTSFNALMEKFSHILSEIVGVISGVGASKENLDNISEKAERIVQEIHHISTGTREQETDIRQAAALTGEAEAQYRRLLERSNEIVLQTQNVSNLCVTGNTHISQLDDQNRMSLSEVNHSYEKILQLNVFSEQVGTIIAQIEDISEQTSLLALNASIEAARAGEQGRGFAIVADQIGKLAANTNESTSVISGIIERLRTEITETVSVVSSIKNSFEKQTVTLEAVKEAFTAFDTSSRATLASIHDMTEMLHDVNHLNNDVVHSIESIQNVSTSVSEKTNVVTNVLETQKEEIARAAEKVADIYQASELLSTDMTKFKVG